MVLPFAMDKMKLNNYCAKKLPFFQKFHPLTSMDLVPNVLPIIGIITVMILFPTHEDKLYLDELWDAPLLRDFHHR